jgi:predicted TIM-barrel fold metal-dependent hydrolase
MIEDFRGFYYEAALSGLETNLVTLENFVEPDHILFGSDFPAVDLATAAWYTPTSTPTSPTARSNWKTSCAATLSRYSHGSERTPSLRAAQ